MSAKSKRITFKQLFTKSAIVALIAAILVNIANLAAIIPESAKRAIASWNMEIYSRITSFNNRDDESLDDTLQSVKVWFLIDDLDIRRHYLDITNKSDIYSTLYDENGKAVVSNRQTFWARIEYQENSDIRQYYCDEYELDFPEVKQHYAEYRAMLAEHPHSKSQTYRLESLYVNEKDHSFVPHKGTWGFDGQDSDFEITFSNPDYELIELKSSLLEYPHLYSAQFCGIPETEPKIGDFDLHMLEADQWDYDSIQFLSSRLCNDVFDMIHVQWSSEHTVQISNFMPLNIKGKKFVLYTLYDVNLFKWSSIWFFIKNVLSSLLLYLLIALIWSKKKDKHNVTAYRLEDCQKKLNDLKTDLQVTQTEMDTHIWKIKKTLKQGDTDAIEAYLDAISNRPLRLNHQANRKLNYTVSDKRWRNVSKD